MSSFAIVIVEFIAPNPVGVKVTTKVVLLPAATVALGGVVKVKIEPPEKVIAPIVNGVVPVLNIVKVLVKLDPTVVEPNIVQSVNEGVASLLTIETALP